MTSRSIAGILAWVFSGGIAAAQGSSPQAAPSPFWQQLQIRQNTNTRRDIAKPAFVMFTIPEDAAATYQIGVGLLAPVVSTTLVDVDVLADYQRNNAVDKAQHVFRTGVTGEWQAWEMAADLKHHAPLFSFRGDFKNDAGKSSRDWQAAIGYTHLFQGQRRFAHPNLPYRFGTSLELLYVPLVSLELEQTVRARNHLEEGLTARLLEQVSFEFFPAPTRLEQRLEFLVTLAHRSDLRTPGNATDDSHPLFTFEANAFPIQAKRTQLGFGVTYVNGEDPDEGFEQQQYWQFSVKFRVK